MKRQQLLLAILAASDGRPYTPVQIQKAVFLVTKNIPELVTQGQNYNFVPYDYGPFDQDVYNDAEQLAQDGLVEIMQVPGAHWKKYAAADTGLDQGRIILNHFSDPRRDYIKSISQWVRSQSFQGLVKSIYNAYPEMKANSIFRG